MTHGPVHPVMQVRLRKAPGHRTKLAVAASTRRVLGWSRGRLAATPSPPAATDHSSGVEHEHRSMELQSTETDAPISSARGGREHEETQSRRHRDWPFLLPIGLLAVAELALVIAWLAPR